jgi:hypothetical protein
MTTSDLNRGSWRLLKISKVKEEYYHLPPPKLPVFLSSGTFVSSRLYTVPNLKANHMWRKTKKANTVFCTDSGIESTVSCVKETLKWHVCHEYLSCHITCLSHPLWFDQHNNIGRKHNSRSPSSHNFLHPPPSQWNIFLNILFLNTFSLCSSLSVRKQVPQPYRMIRNNDTFI